MCSEDLFACSELIAVGWSINSSMKFFSCRSEFIRILHLSMLQRSFFFRSKFLFLRLHSEEMMNDKLELPLGEIL